jgi:hypothetical protein
VSMFEPVSPSTAAPRTWWLVPELVALVALLVLAIPYLSTAPGERFKSEVGHRAARLIEGSSLEEHQDHGHAVAAEDHVVCGVDVFGTEPAGVNNADEVTVVYGYYFCAVGPTGRPYLESSRMDGPVVVTLLGAPSVRIARHGQGYEARVRDMMPDQYEPLCFGGLRNDTVAADVRRRFTDLAGAG